MMMGFAGTRRRALPDGGLGPAGSLLQGRVFAACSDAFPAAFAGELAARFPNAQTERRLVGLIDACDAGLASHGALHRWEALIESIIF
jgi:hypothetical protein